MRALLQRVQRAWVEVDANITGQIQLGLLVYVAFVDGDTPTNAAKMAKKIASLRVFDDGSGKLNLSLQDVRGGVLVVSNFTLAGNAAKGRRPDFTSAASAEQANELYECFLNEMKKSGCNVASGVFGANMQVASLADGPVNIVIDMPPASNKEPPITC